MTDGILDGYETDCPHVAYLGTDRLSGEMVQMPISRFNRHGLVAGATGTGKSRTIQQIAEWCSQAEVPVLLCDGKGDMSGLAKSGVLSERARKRTEVTGQDTWWEGNSFPVQFLAPGGQGSGVPMRITVGSFQYKSLAKIIGLTPAQTNALGSVFLYARRANAELETIEDLQQYVRLVRDDPESSISSGVCNRISDALNLFEENNPGLFGGPEFDVMDLLKVTDGWGNISIIDSSQLVDNPDVLTTFLLWLMAQLNSVLPEVGDQDKPRLVFFFDEAHMMFQDAPKEFTRSVLRLVKSIRSKGVGIFFISQSGADIPDAILGQCGNRIQHTIRANTPAQLRDLRKTADTFPISSRYDVAAELSNMEIGEALACIIDDDGRCTTPAVTMMYVPRSSMEPLSDEEIWQHTRRSPLWLKFRDAEREWRESKLQASMPPSPEVRSYADNRQSAAARVVDALSVIRGTKEAVSPEPEDSEWIVG